MKEYPIEEIFRMAKKKGLKRPRWGSRPLKVYNGFSHEQRVRGWQAASLAVKMGLKEPADAKDCEICGASKETTDIVFHSEDYNNVFTSYSVCKKCHVRIHNRFRYNSKWLDYIAPFSDGTKWFERLSLVDLYNIGTGISKLRATTALARLKSKYEGITIPPTLDREWVDRLRTWEGFLENGPQTAAIILRWLNEPATSTNRELRHFCPELWDLVLEAFPHG